MRILWKIRSMPSTAPTIYDTGVKVAFLYHPLIRKKNRARQANPNRMPRSTLPVEYRKISNKALIVAQNALIGTKI